MSLAGDHSTSGAIIGGSLRQAGFVGIVRYACEGRGDVNITPSEVKDLQANGIQIGIVCEHEADWLLRPGVGGRVAGSREITRACGLPDGVTFLAADFDVTNGGPTAPGSRGDHNMQAVAVALTEAAGVLGRKNVGFYGSKFAIDWLLAHGWGDILFWQTEAWSMGQRSPHACLFQRAASTSVHGVAVDIDEVWKPSWGQRVAAPAPAPELPKPPGLPLWRRVFSFGYARGFQAGFQAGWRARR